MRIKKRITEGLLIALLYTVFAACLTGCEFAEEQGENVDVYKTYEFELKLFTDKQTYNTAEAIKIWATLEYIGDTDTVIIWHSNPYISFTITDGDKLNLEGIINLILMTTVLNKNEIYHFDYKKSGAWDLNAYDESFWKEFFAEKELRLPAGEYTVSVKGAFSLTDKVTDNESGLACELQIKVR